METFTSSTVFTLSLSNPLMVLGMVAVLWSKSFRNFVENWGFLFMILCWYFYGIIGWLLLWIFYELVVFMHNNTKAKTKKVKKKTKDTNDQFFDDLKNKKRKQEAKKYI